MSSSASTSKPAPPTIDLAPFLNPSDADVEALAAKECEKVAASLRDFGILIVKDPRVTMDDNATFIDLMEKYYSQPTEDKLKDARPEISYQLGVVPEGTEVPRDWSDKIKHLKDENAAHEPHGADVKWRFHWRIGETPKDTKFPRLNPEPVVPEKFKDEWATNMDKWGYQLVETAKTCAKMAAKGFGLAEDSFSKLMEGGPHLLAPTGADLKTYGELGQVLAGFHTDLNFLTIHGKSRFPGLFIWLRDGTKIPVRVPEGCLLLQAGQQFEYLTGGHVLAGFHEVIVAEDTVKAVEKALAEGRIPWRVSSTVFSHIASDQTLEPLGDFATEDAKNKYPAMYAGDQVQRELDIIKLGGGNFAMGTA